MGSKKNRRRKRDLKKRPQRKTSPSIKAPYILLIIVVVTLTAFAPSINNGFTNWDDSGYVTENYIIRDLSATGLKKMFSTYVEGNYHPLTMLSFALDYRAHKLNPEGYHFKNVLLHIVNTLLVFYLIYLLTNSIQISAIASLFFGIHPLHVESVAWISARKDVLYVLFYIASCITYIFYLRREKFKGLYYGGALALFLFSLLSKGMAVSLPAVLLLIDFATYRKITIRSLFDKIPFIGLSLVFGVVAVIAQSTKGAIQEISLFPLAARVLFAFYGIVSYLFRSLVPVKLSAFYPYPKSVSALSPIFYLCPLFVAAAALLSYWTLRYTRVVVFAGLFFLSTVVLVLQLFPVGSAIISDRYTYLPYVGVGLALGYLYHWLMSGNPVRRKQIRTAIIVAFLLFGVVLVRITQVRCEVWKDNLTLWTDVISKYPDATVAYNNRALTYKKEGRHELATADLEIALSINPRDADALCNRGNYYFAKGEYNKALSDLDKSLQAKSFATGYNSRGAVYFYLSSFDKALEDFNRAIQLKPDYPEAYLNRANVFSVMQKYDRALADFDTYIRYNSNNANAYHWRGLAKYGLGDFSGAIRDYAMALRLHPQFGEAYLSRSKAFEALKRPDSALDDALKAQSLGQKVDQDYLDKLENSIR